MDQNKKYIHRSVYLQSMNSKTQAHIQSLEDLQLTNNVKYFDNRSAVYGHTSQENYEQEKNRRTSYSPMPYTISKQLQQLSNKQSFQIKKSAKAQIEIPSQHSHPQSDSEKQTIKVSNDRLSRYENIVTLTEQQNQNLKQQNKYLVAKLREMQAREQKFKKIYTKTKSYKTRWQQIRNEIDIAKEQTYIYRQYLQDLQQIARIDIPVLSKKVIDTEQQMQSMQSIKNPVKNRGRRQLLCLYNNSPKKIDSTTSFMECQSIREELQENDHRVQQNNETQPQK